MKKFYLIICITLTVLLSVFLSSCVSMSTNDNIQPVSYKNVTLPDGNVADIKLFPNWKQAGAYLKEIKPKNKRTYYAIEEVGLKGASFSPDVSVNTKGYLRKTWVGTDSKVKALYNTMAAGKYRFAIGGIQKNDEWLQIMITCKNGNLTYDRTGYVDENSKLYKEAVAKRESKSSSSRISFSSGSTSSSSNKNNNSNASSKAAQNERFQRELYRLRHETNEGLYFGNGHAGGYSRTPDFRYIYYDNGEKVYGYVVLLDGNFISEYDTYKVNPRIIPYYSVPKQIRELALKSLD